MMEDTEIGGLMKGVGVMSTGGTRRGGGMTLEDMDTGGLVKDMGGWGQETS